jgi:hypothetical protein
MSYKNIPQSVLKLVQEQTNLNQREKEEVLHDLETQYTKKQERKQKHEHSLKNNSTYSKLYDIWNKNLNS